MKVLQILLNFVKNVHGYFANGTAMKVYAYTYEYDKIKSEGYKSLAMFDKNSEHFKGILMTHRHSAGSEDPGKIIAYLERTFPGRLRSVCVLTETAPVREYAHPYLNCLVHNADIVSFDLDRLIKDGLVEAVYCKDIRKTVLTEPYFENIYKVNDLSSLGDEPCDWHLCETEKYKNVSPWATVKHYMLVLTNGYIPSEYVMHESGPSV